jgi:hypothetical protein
MFFKKRAKAAVTPPPVTSRTRQKVTVDASDNLFVRAEKIVAMLGITEDYKTAEYDVYRALYTYAELDAEAAKTAKPVEDVKLCQCDKP